MKLRKIWKNLQFLYTKHITGYTAPDQMIPFADKPESLLHLPIGQFLMVKRETPKPLLMRIKLSNRT